MLDDLKTEATRLIAADLPQHRRGAGCGWWRGNDVPVGDNPATKASQFLNVSSRRVPIHVIAIAPIRPADRTQLQAIATASGGRFTEITADMVDVTTVGAGKPVPEFVQRRELRRLTRLRRSG